MTEYSLSSQDAALDIAREHLDEAAGLLSHWRSALDSPLYTLGELAETVEARLLASLDGLAQSGSHVPHALLLPLVREPSDAEPERLQAAGLALVNMGREDVIVMGLSSGSAQIRGAAEQVLSLAGSESFDQWLTSVLAETQGHPLRARLLELAATRGLAVPNLQVSLQSADAEEARAAARVALRSPSRGLLPTLESLVELDTPGLSETARLAALALGSGYAFERVRAQASGTERSDGPSMMLLALLGSHHDCALLVAHAERPTHQHDALSALGFTGSVSALDAVIGSMRSRDARAARLAGEAFSIITGVDLTEAPFFQRPAPDEGGLVPFEEDDLDADLTYDEADDLPLPNADLIAVWWRDNGSRFDPAVRYLAGEPWRLGKVVEQLEHGPMRRRHTLATWLALRSAGAAYVDTRAMSWTQRTQMARASKLSDAMLTQSFV